MRIAIVHSFYSSSQPSGENRVVEDQVSLLRQAGHEVALVARQTDTEELKPFYQARAASWVATGRGSDPTGELQEFGPDVVHVHNLFPNFGTRWLHAWQGPIVASIHNYRFICSTGTLFRNERVCFECPQHGDAHALMHRCYRDSTFATLPLVISRSGNRSRVLARADAVVATSSWSEAVLRRYTPASVQWTLIPNSGPDDGVNPRFGQDRARWLALGRFSPEKGFEQLLECWPRGYELDVIGDGTRSREVTAIASRKGVMVESSITREELRERLPTYLGLVFPSRWLEVAPQVVVEAMRVGLPVIAYEANGVSGLVQSTGTGRSYGDESSLQSALDQTQEDLDRYSQRAYDHYRRFWRPSVWLDSMTRLYERLAAGDK